MRGGTLAAVVALLLLALAPALGALPARAGPVPADTSYPPLSTSLNGPTTVGTLLSVNYTVNATGGPATALNGTVVGSYTYTASFTATNRTGLVLGPATQGVILNGSASLRFTAGNVTEPVTIAVLITSTYQGTNVSKNVTLLINIVQPFVLSTTLVVGSGAGVAQFHLEVDLDGAAVGQILIPTLTAGTSYPVSYRYVNPGLAPGWHTFSLSLANEHGLVKFASGAEGFSQSFYVAGSPPDNTLWYLSGAVAFVGAILIWTMRVGARRRGKGKK